MTASRLTRRRLAVRAGALALSAAGTLLAGPSGRPARAFEDSRFLRIGAGSITGTYYPIGSLIAGIVSNPPGARPCGEAGACGVPGLIAIVQTSRGSVDNVEAIHAGQIESGFVQSDVAHAAFTGTGMFAGRPPFRGLRALSSLYPESVHLVAAADSGIRSVPELRGHSVSLDAEGSGTLVDARMILEAFEIDEKDIVAAYLPPVQAIGMMREKRLDAFFIVAGYPAAAVVELVAEAEARLVPISGPEVERLIARHAFLERDVIPPFTYPGIATATPTVSVAALWLVSSEMEDDLAHALVRSLYHPRSREALDDGHPKGKAIRLEAALRGVAVPLHPGAERFYRERGLIP